MTKRPDTGSDNTERAQKKERLPIMMTLDALLSVAFLVLAAYIWYYAPAVSGNNGRDLLYFSILLGAYGIWRAIRSVIRHRRREWKESL
jgi:heme/copper-type cytochrome/quinol oxidase subunit 3